MKSGVHEILAGEYEGTPEKDAQNTYFAAPQQWMRGNLDARIPGAENGREFLTRFNTSIASIYDGGKRNAVVFSHAGAISTWALIGTVNGIPDYVEKAQTAQLKNVGYVVLKGEPGAWRIVQWVGSPDLPAVPDCPLGGLGSSSGSLMPC